MQSIILFVPICVHTVCFVMYIALTECNKRVHRKKRRKKALQQESLLCKMRILCENKHKHKRLEIARCLSAALVRQVHCLLHNTQWYELHCIALNWTARHGTAMEYIVHSNRNNSNNNRENRPDMIQMNNKIVYCVKDHHGVSIKTSKKHTSEDKAMQKKKNREGKKCAHKTTR